MPTTGACVVRFHVHQQNTNTGRSYYIKSGTNVAITPIDNRDNDEYQKPESNGFHGTELRISQQHEQWSERQKGLEENRTEEKEEEEEEEEKSKEDDEPRTAQETNVYNKPKCVRHKEEFEDPEFEDNLGSFFFEVTGEDELMNAYELQSVMTMIFEDDFTVEEFSLETCRSLISCVDKNRMGNLTYNQFKTLWHSIIEWKHIFELCDENKDRHIDRRELGIAVREKLNIEILDKTLDLLVIRYKNRDGIVNIDDFFTICAKLKATTASYERIHNSNEIVPFGKYLTECIYS